MANSQHSSGSAIDVSDRIFYLDPEASPFTHIFNKIKPRWPEGQFKCLQRQGYKGKNNHEKAFEAFNFTQIFTFTS